MISGEGLDPYVTIVIGGVLGTFVGVILQVAFEAFNPAPWNVLVNQRNYRVRGQPAKSARGSGKSAMRPANGQSVQTRYALAAVPPKNASSSAAVSAPIPALPSPTASSYVQPASVEGQSLAQAQRPIPTERLMKPA